MPISVSIKTTGIEAAEARLAKAHKKILDAVGKQVAKAALDISNEMKRSIAKGP